MGVITIILALVVWLIGVALSKELFEVINRRQGNTVDDPNDDVLCIGSWLTLVVLLCKLTQLKIASFRAKLKEKAKYTNKGI